MIALYEDRDRLRTFQNSLNARRDPLNPDANRNAGEHRVSMLSRRPLASLTLKENHIRGS